MRLSLSLLSILFLLAACETSAPGTIPDPPEPEDRALHCPDRDSVLCAEDVGGIFPFIAMGNTLEGDDGYDRSACGGGGGAVLDDAYRWTAPWAGRFVFTTEGSAFDTILSLRQGSCAGREIACSDDARGGGVTSELTADLAECQTVTVVVDGGLGATIEGAYVLQIRALETLCDDGMDDDLDGLVDCDDDDCFTARCADPENDDWPVEWSAEEWRVLELTNQARAIGADCGPEGMFGPADPLEMDPLLRLSSRLHSTDMAENSYFDHQSPDGRGPVDRILETGFLGAGPFGENIAEGHPDAEAVVAGWLSSPGHCANMMNPTYRAIGVGAARAGAGALYWTQNFAGGR